MHSLMARRRPKSGINFISEIIEFTKDKSAELATVCGRYYAMDRDRLGKNKKSI